MSGKEPVSENIADELKDVFEMFDTSKTGKLTKSDLGSVLNQFDIRVASEDIDKMFKEADVLGKGNIGFPEFMSMMSKKMQMTSSEVQLKRAFGAFDKAGEGKIPTPYLSDELTSRGDKLSRKEMQTLIDIAENESQEIVYQMFIGQLFAKKGQ